MSFNSHSIYQSPSASKEPPTYNEIGGEYPEDFPVTILPEPIYDEQGNPVYILTSENFLYRGSETPGVPLEDLIDIKWFGLDLKNVLEYGYPSQYKLNTNLKLLAIDEINETHPFFIGLHGKIKRKFEIFIRTNNGIRERVSIPQNDYDLCEYICNLGYDGYAMKEMKSDNHDNHDDMFHAEVALQNGNEKLIEPVHINVNELTYEDGRKLEILGEEATIENIKERIKEYKKQKDKMFREEAARKAKEEKRARARGEMNLKRERDPPLFHNTMFLDEDNDDDNDPFVMRGNIFNFGSPRIDSSPKRQNTDLRSPLPFSYSSPYSSPSIKSKGGKTKKRNRKTKKNKKKQTKKKNKKSKRKSNKK